MSDEVKTTQETPKNTQKKSVGKRAKPTTVMVRLDMEIMEVLRLNQDENVKLVWDPSAFKRLEDEEVRQLTPGNMEAYFKAKIRADEEAAELEKQARLDMDVMSPLEMRSSYRLKIRPRSGWHQAWKAPGPDFDAAMAGPYKQVRKPTAQQEKDGYEPGEESGEVLKLLDGEGKVELIAVECRQDLFERHLEAMARKSSQQFAGVKDNFYRAIEEINQKQTNRRARIIPQDKMDERFADDE